LRLGNNRRNSTTKHTKQHEKGEICAKNNILYW
jgi:hypothetical protein